MEKYKFKLQRLLDIRMDKEEESKINFKEAQREKSSIEEKLNHLKDNYSKYNIVDVKQSIIEQKIKNNYLNALNLNINETNLILTDKMDILESKREELKQKQIERKTVEILKEKQQLSFNKIQEQEEQKTNDELALYAFVRNLERR